jgi:hypothetical protein
MERTPDRRTPTSAGASRRDFLKLGALAAAAAGAPASARSLLEGVRGGPAGTGRGNSLPGRIVLYQDDAMGGHLSVIDSDYTEQVVWNCARLLTGIPDPGQAFESLFPGVHAASTFAIKVNCIGSCDTRWEAVRGIVSGLSLMLGGSYDVSRVTIYDSNNLSSHGYTPDRFTFNGHTAVIASSSSPGSYYPYPGYRLSNYIVNSNYVINMPVLKSHDNTQNQITMAFKNHYGSCSPQSLCGNITGMLTVNSDAHVKDKTGLVVTSALRGTYNGGPGSAPQWWDTFPEHTPNMLLFTTDPTCNEYWARSIINTERAAHGWAAKPCPWVETSAAPPYSLGVCDPLQMTVVEPTAVEETPAAIGGAVFLAPSSPNPFRESTTMSFHLGTAGTAALVVLDASGRVVRRLAERGFPAGSSQLAWDGRDDAGRALAAGVYFARLETGAGARTRRMVLTR